MGGLSSVSALFLDPFLQGFLPLLFRRSGFGFLPFVSSPGFVSCGFFCRLVTTLACSLYFHFARRFCFSSCSALLFDLPKRHSISSLIARIVRERLADPALPGVHALKPLLIFTYRTCLLQNPPLGALGPTTGVFLSSNLVFFLIHDIQAPQTFSRCGVISRSLSFLERPFRSSPETAPCPFLFFSLFFFELPPSWSFVVVHACQAVSFFFQVFVSLFSVLLRSRSLPSFFANAASPSFFCSSPPPPPPPPTPTTPTPLFPPPSSFFPFSGLDSNHLPEFLPFFSFDPRCGQETFFGV